MKTKAFRLTCDVKNPKPDRRSKDWYCLPSWTAGTVFYTFIDCNRECIYTGGYTHQAVTDGNPIFKALRPNLEEIPDNEKDLKMLLKECDAYCHEYTAFIVLEQLLKMGKISNEDIGNLYEAYERQFDNQS